MPMALFLRSTYRLQLAGILLFLFTPSLLVAGGRKPIQFPAFPEYQARLQKLEAEAEPIVRRSIDLMDQRRATDRAIGASMVKAGNHFQAAIPALVELLSDTTHLEWRLLREGAPLQLVNPREGYIVIEADGLGIPPTRPVAPRPTSPAVEAWQALLRIGAPAEEFFIYCLKDPKHRLRGLAAEKLRHFESAESARQLVLAAEDRNPELRDVVLQSLEVLKPRSEVEALIALLARDKEPGKIAAVLGPIGDPRAVDPLLALLAKEKSPGKIATALGQLGDRRAVEPLIPALTRGYGDSRALVAEALGRLQDPRAADALILALQKDGFLPTRKEAAWALGEIGDLKAIPVLIAELEKNRPNWMERNRPQDIGPWPGWIRSAIAGSLRKLTGQNHGQDYARWKAWWAEAAEAKPQGMASPP